jgi:polar amino acid transport system substrate-binding protein
MRLSFIALAVAAAVAAGPAQAETVRATTVTWEPYYGEDLKDQGVIAALASEVFARRGHELTVRFLPWRRAVAKARAGEYDAVLGAYKTEERKRDFLFSEPFYTIEVALIARKDLGLSPETPLEDLKPYRIGYSQGWAYGERFENADYLQKDPASNHTLNVRKFFAGRLDIVAMARSIFEYEADQMQGADRPAVTVLEPPLMMGKLHMMFPKANDNAEQLREDFNAALEAIRADGTYERILADYGF